MIYAYTHHNIFSISLNVFVAMHAACCMLSHMQRLFYRSNTGTAGVCSLEENTMRTYEETLLAVIRYFEKHGKTQATCDKLETMLPSAWAANLIADALDMLS